MPLKPANILVLPWLPALSDRTILGPVVRFVRLRATRECRNLMLKQVYLTHNFHSQSPWRATAAILLAVMMVEPR